MDVLKGWTGRCIFGGHRQGVLRTSVSGVETYVCFSADDLYVDGALWSDWNGSQIEDEMFHFDAHKEYGFVSGYKVSYKVKLVWMGQKPIFDEESSDQTDGSCSEDDFSEEESETAGENTDESCSEEETETDEDSEIYGYVGSVVQFVNSCTAVLKFSIGGDTEFAALERCRLYVDEKLCTNRHDISRYIDCGDSVNFDAEEVDLGYGIEYRVITGWIGKKPRGDDFITSEYAPNHAIRFPAQFQL
ncbi:uncharacterized protein LOC132194942 [Neocloeon triangulifer]|uniref:uncharacterized protein LOC132194942 n=1 Tax=Neocloeon triangulifer TaxID=2078957 RepID=UPI00286F1AFC|nr:uncharacterized protein LOC132194942 [Neocloeon triangulifer]XP_059472532.1 uncharacterized protein LOC132194942 [Neocloeon triangulifer]